jgi:hypothetical protein
MTDTNAIDYHVAQLGRLVGTWDLEATHPSVPGLVVRGTADIAWLDGQRFLIHRATMEHPDFPSSISILGRMDRDRVADAQAPAGEPRLCMHYFDSRGVFRVFELSIERGAWQLERLAPGFSQRFRGAFVEGGDVITGSWQLCEDDAHWRDDLEITYRRRR